MKSYRTYKGFTRLTISVTAADIAKGVPDEPRYCPIARAAKRALHIRNVTVPGELQVTRRGIETWIELPYEAATFIETFDAGGTVEPFQFKVRVPHGV